MTNKMPEIGKEYFFKTDGQKYEVVEIRYLERHLDGSFHNVVMLKDSKILYPLEDFFDYFEPLPETNEEPTVTFQYGFGDNPRTIKEWHDMPNLQKEPQPEIKQEPIDIDKLEYFMVETDDPSSVILPEPKSSWMLADKELAKLLAKKDNIEWHNNLHFFIKLSNLQEQPQSEISEEDSCSCFKRDTENEIKDGYSEYAEVSKEAQEMLLKMVRNDEIEKAKEELRRELKAPTEKPIEKTLNFGFLILEYYNNLAKYAQDLLDALDKQQNMSINQQKIDIKEKNVDSKDNMGEYNIPKEPVSGILDYASKLLWKDVKDLPEKGGHILIRLNNENKAICPGTYNAEQGIFYVNMNDYERSVIYPADIAEKKIAGYIFLHDLLSTIESMLERINKLEGK